MQSSGFIRHRRMLLLFSSSLVPTLSTINFIYTLPSASLSYTVYSICIRVSIECAAEQNTIMAGPSLGLIKTHGEWRLIRVKK
jgi:hypothetical protein